MSESIKEPLGSVTNRIEDYRESGMDNVKGEGGDDKLEGATELTTSDSESEDEDEDIQNHDLASPSPSSSTLFKKYEKSVHECREAHNTVRSKLALYEDVVNDLRTQILELSELGPVKEEYMENLKEAEASLKRGKESDVEEEANMLRMEGRLEVARMKLRESEEEEQELEKLEMAREENFKTMMSIFGLKRED